MSHEFRTPLGTSLIFLENLMGIEGLSPNILETLNIVSTQLTFLLSLVNSILDIKMIEGGSFVPKLESFNPVAVLEFIITIFKPLTDL
jgi:signal transduction histidine kinase